MPAQFSGFGISLMYPENWKVEEQSDESVTLESPSGAFLTVTRFPPSMTAGEAIERAQKTMADEYDQVEQEPLERELSGIRLSGTLQRFVYLDLIITSQLLAFERDEHSYLVQIQAEDRELDELQSVFDAMLTYMCQQMSLSQ